MSQLLFFLLLLKSTLKTKTLFLKKTREKPIHRFDENQAVENTHSNNRDDNDNIEDHIFKV